MEKLNNEISNFSMTMNITEFEVNSNTLKNEFYNSDTFVGVNIKINNELKDDELNIVTESGFKIPVCIGNGFKVDHKKEYLSEWIK